MATKPKSFTHQFPAWPEHIAEDRAFWCTNRKGAPVAGSKAVDQRVNHHEDGLLWDVAELEQLKIAEANDAPNVIAYSPRKGHNIAILDIDTGKVHPKNENRKAIEKHHADLLEAFKDTYVEVSRSGNGHHVIFLLPDGHGLEPKRVNSQAHVELFVSTGYVLLTGNCVTTDRLATITDKELATLRRLFPEYDTDASGAPSEGAEEMSYDELISRMKNTGPRWVRLLTGEGDGELDTDLSKGPCRANPVGGDNYNGRSGSGRPHLANVVALVVCAGSHPSSIDFEPRPFHGKTKTALHKEH